MLRAVAEQAASGDGFSNGVVTFAYIITSLVAVGGIIAGARRYVTKQRDKWTDEGQSRAQQVQATKLNNERLEANTAAIAGLSAKFGEFADAVHRRFDTVESALNTHDRRISLLEDKQGIPHVDSK